jgi:hypothetical protein
MIQKLNEFFQRPAINKSGFCVESKISQQYLNSVLSEKNPLTDKFYNKILPILKRYGYL